MDGAAPGKSGSYSRLPVKDDFANNDVSVPQPITHDGADTQQGMPPVSRISQMVRDAETSNHIGEPPLAPPCGSPSERQWWNAHVAAGKAMTILQQKAKGHCAVETGSVYGIAMAIPQLARTAGWSLRYTEQVVSAYVFLISNIMLQGFLLYMLAKEERINARYSGQMHLCNFGAGIQQCPDGADCIGPGGTVYTPERLYNWEMWNTRQFVHDSFKALFPDRAGEIDAKIDPGEYGLESYWLRVVCCFLFVMGCWGDLKGSMVLLQLLWTVPSRNEPWMVYEIPRWATNKEHAKAVHGWSELDLVKFKVAGMSRTWKLLNLFLIFLPKVYVWLLTVCVGMTFLLETSDIEDMIINAVALAFILSIDELICGTLMSPISTYMVEHLEPFPLFETADEEDDTEEDAFAKHQLDKDKLNIFSVSLWLHVFPLRFLGIVIVTAFFICKYYSEHCITESDGSLYSKPVLAPLSDSLAFLSFLFDPIPHFYSVEVDTSEEGILWAMSISDDAAEQVGLSEKNVSILNGLNATNVTTV